jgi:hypothetical protein
MIGGRVFLLWDVDAIMQEADNARNEKRNGGGERNLTRESILEEIWYKSRGLHLFAAPIHVLKGTWWTQSEPFITRPELKCTQ